MLDPPPSEDELKRKGEPVEKVRSGRRMGASQVGNGRAQTLLPVEVTWVSRWRAHTQTYNILGLDEAKRFRAAFRCKHFQSCS
jgi:hypothetical protein